MSKGVDVNQDCTAHIPCLVEGKYTFVGRYYGHSKHAPLTRQEARSLSAAGLSVVAVWESGFPTRSDYFSHAKGVADGASAYHYALEVVGQPLNTPIYFTVDYDAAPGEIAEGVMAYFQGVQDAFRTINKRSARSLLRKRVATSSYAIGVYGSGAVCAHVQRAKLVTHTWLAQSAGWASTKTYTAWNIRQGATKTICGMDADTDEMGENGGSFKIL